MILSSRLEIEHLREQLGHAEFELECAKRISSYARMMKETARIEAQIRHLKMQIAERVRSAH